jgi:predicted O-linked N-acetylglucosamine transferase (SPINDLY family)
VHVSIPHTLMCGRSTEQLDHGPAVAYREGVVFGMLPAGVVMTHSQAWVHLRRGRACRDRNDFAAAAAEFRQAVDSDPNLAEALADLADALAVLGRPDEAVRYWERALARGPESALWHCGLADARHAQGQVPEAIEAYREAVARDAGLVRAWWGLGCACLTGKDYAAAAEALGRVVALAPDQGPAWHNLGSAHFELGQADAAHDAYAQALALLGANEATLSAIATCIPGCSRADHRAVLDARRRWAALAAPDTPPRSFSPRPGGPRRLGYVCGFFEDRNWMKPVWGLINRHDRQRFEIHLFSDAPESRLGPGCVKDARDHFHDTTGLDNAALARLVDECSIDILIDLNAFSRIGRLPLFALRPAPVQIAWFNMFATSGMGCFDALIGDAHVVLPEEEPFYTEPVVRVPGCYLTFEVSYPVPDVAPAPSRARGAVTFGCLAPQYKITPDAIAALARILKASPTARLVLKSRFLASAQNRHYVEKQFAAAEVETGRLDLDGPAEHFAFLTRYSDIDVALDTFPYSGGTTTMESLWQGVPVLCFAGDRWAARISASLMHNAGLEEFVAPNLDSYIARAVELANDVQTPAKLDALRQAMRERLRQSPVCAVESFARQMEEIYLQVWQRRFP